MFFKIENCIGYGVFDNIFYARTVFRIFLFDLIVVFGIIANRSVYFYVISLN